MELSSEAARTAFMVGGGGGGAGSFQANMEETDGERLP